MRWVIIVAALTTMVLGGTPATGQETTPAAPTTPAATPAPKPSADVRPPPPEKPMTVYTKDNAPSAPKPDALPLKSSVSQYGITWTFAKPAPVGQFINGDYYVVGPVTITAIDPKPLFGKDVPAESLDGNDKKNAPDGKYVRHGSMVNPPLSGMSYDSGIRHVYDAQRVTAPPYDLKPGDNIVSTISLMDRKEMAGIVGYGNSSRSRAKHDNCPIRVAAVLTCVAEPLAADAFRPAYGDRQRTIYYARNLRRELLPKLARPAEGVPDPVTYGGIFQRVWLNTYFFGFDEPMENMPHYGQQVCQAVSDAGLLLCLDFTPEQKERLLVNFVQVGIDYWGLAKSGHPGWRGFGGHGSGRKFPIVFAGYLLGDDQMASPGKAFPKTEYGEDNQTYYGECWTGAKVVFTGHGAISTATGKVMQDKTGPYEHMHPSNWNRNGRKDTTSDGYRRNNTSCAWVGQALALRILKLESQWNWPAFFDYVDRWMTEPDMPNCTEINKYFPSKSLMDPSKEWCHQGNPGEPWIGEMWKKYRSLNPAPTDGWKTLKANPNGLQMPKLVPLDPNAKPAAAGATEQKPEED
jgi:hypothetical protein